ncbi:hypothetical protein [Aeromonas phage AerS_266]|nr:hypothetical protein [Aeromonas phage AerS_266]
MNVNIDQMDHAFDVLSGFESICNKDFKTINAKYTQSVLRLNGCDLAAIAGQEGLGSAIKAGAKKVVEMIWNLIKGIKEFFFGSKSKIKDVQIKEIEKETKVVLQAIKKQPDLKETVENKVQQIKPSINKIENAGTVEAIELRFGPYVSFMTEYFNEVADAKTEGYLAAAQTGKATLQLDWRKSDHLKLLSAFNVLSKSFQHSNKNGKSEEIEVVAVIESIETGSKVIEATEKFRTVAKDVLQNVNDTLEKSTIYYEKLIKDGNEHRSAEAVLKFTQSLGKAATKMSKLVAECDNFIIQIGSAISKINKEVGGTSSKLENIVPAMTSIEDLDKFMHN